MDRFYTVDIKGYKADLPILPLPNGISICFFNLHGNQEMTEHCGKELAKLLHGCDIVLTAESKGLSQGQIIRRHILRNAFIPVMTQLPMSVAMCITGSFFIESIYAIPGIGQYYVTAVNNQDLSIVLGETVLISILYILVLFVTDILYVVVDPRIQLPSKKRR